MLSFAVDGRDAGPGHLAILVDGGRVTSQVKALGDHRFRAVFLPHDSGPHSVDMTFNGVVVPGLFKLFFYKTLPVKQSYLDLNPKTGTEI